MKEKIKPSLLPGFMELIPSEQLIFEDMVGKMREVYEQNGCLPIDTPIIEKEEILLAKSAGETEKQVYRIDNERTKQALRFDLTVPFARYVVQHLNDMTFPFKRYQLGKVYRGERNQKGRYREFYQLDLDIVNPNKLDIVNDAFVISLAAKAFQSIGLKTYRFQISNRKILSGVLALLEVSETQLVMGIIDKYDKIGKENCQMQLEEAIGCEKAGVLQECIEISGTQEQCITQLKEQLSQMKIASNGESISQEKGLLMMEEGISELEEVVEVLALLGVKEENFCVDLKIIRGLDYYTGTIFETILVGNTQYGSICSGGRYDNLTTFYSDQKMPGVGISIGVTRLFFVLKEIGFIEKYTITDKINYLVCRLGDTLPGCIEVNNYLQERGITSEVYLNQAPLKKQLTYANTKKVRQVILIAEEEWQRGEIILKDMAAGTQATLRWETFKMQLE